MHPSACMESCDAMARSDSGCPGAHSGYTTTELSAEAREVMFHCSGIMILSSLAFLFAFSFAM